MRATNEMLSRAIVRNGSYAGMAGQQKTLRLWSERGFPIVQSNPKA